MNVKDSHIVATYSIAWAEVPNLFSRAPNLRKINKKQNKQHWRGSSYRKVTYPNVRDLILSVSQSMPDLKVCGDVFQGWDTKDIMS